MDNWISVDEKLPESYQQVLVFLVDVIQLQLPNQKFCDIRTAAYVSASGSWYDFQINETTNKDPIIEEYIAKITHWMHLPEKPIISAKPTDRFGENNE